MTPLRLGSGLRRSHVFFCFFCRAPRFQEKVRERCGDPFVTEKNIYFFPLFFFFRFACVLQFSLQSRTGVYEYENSRVASGAVLVRVRMVAAAAAELPCVKGAI